MAVVFKNNAKTTLSAGITSSATSITVSDGSVFPSLSGGDVFFLTLDDGTNNEIVKCTAISTNTLTVVRAQESTTARAFSSGDAAELRITAGILGLFSQTDASITDEIEAYLDANGTTFPDDVKAQFGTGNDFGIKHDGSHTYLQNSTGHVYFQQLADDMDIVFQSDNGSGGVQPYFFLDGSAEQVVFEKSARFTDNDQAILGTGSDLRLFHNGTDSYIQNHTGSLNIENYSDDKDIYFKSDDGLGGLITYFFLDGSDSSTRFTTNPLKFNDNIKAQFGTGSDLQIYHDGSNSYVTDNGTGNLYLTTNGNKVIIGDTSGERGIEVVKDGEVLLKHNNNNKLQTTSTGIDVTGTAVVDALTSSGLATVDELSVTNDSTFNGGLDINGDATFGDSNKAIFGTGSDLQIYHTGSHSYIYDTGTGNLVLKGQEVVIQSGNSSESKAIFRDDGAAELYFNDSLKIATTSSGAQITGTLDVDVISNASGVVHLNDTLYFQDNSKAVFGDSSDLQIYHNGSHSNIQDTGTGNLRIAGSIVEIAKNDFTETMAKFTQDGAVELYYDNSKKFETTSSGMAVTGNISTTGGATIGDSSADALTFFGILKQGGSGGTTVIDSSRALQNITGASFTSGTRDLDLILADTPSTGNAGVQFRAGASDYLGLAAGGGTDVGIVIDSSNKVGIGTNPSVLLDVHKDSTSGQVAEFRNDTGFFLHRTYADYNNGGTTVEFQTRVGVDGNYSTIGNYSENDFYIRTNNIDRLKFNNNGIDVRSNGTLKMGGTVVIDASRNITAGTVQATSFSDGTISGITFVDEDNMSSNSATKVPTQQSVKAYVDAEVAGVVDSAPAALDTLNELAAALGDDANFSATTSAALGNRLRVDINNQGLTGTQQGNALTNLGITASKAELNYVDGVTSNIQTQLDGKQASGSYLTGNQTITLSGDVSGSGTTSITVTVADDSHNHVISNVDGLQAALDAKLASSSYTASDVLTKIKTVDGSGSGLDADTVDGINGASFLRSDAADTASELITAQKGISSDGAGKMYSWRAVDNTSSSGDVYQRIARISHNQSSRYTVELVGRFSSYSDGNFPSWGKIVGQHNNDNNSDLVFYDFRSGMNSDSSKVVYEVGQVNVNNTTTDIYVKVGSYSELSAFAHMSDGTLTPYESDSSSSTAPTGYSAITTVEVWNSNTDGSGSGLDADLLDGQHGSHYLNYNNLTNTPTIPTNNNQLTNGAGYITSGGNISGTAGGLSGTPNITVGTISSGAISGSASYHEFGNSVGSVSNDGSWNARLNLAGSGHARLDVKSVSDGIIGTIYAHTGHGAARFGTLSAHNLQFMYNGTPYIHMDSNGNLDLTTNSDTGDNFIHLPRSGGITFYGDNNAHHGIFSRDQTGTGADDILLSSYGAFYIDLDSNTNNGSGADFVIGRHNVTNENIFVASGERTYVASYPQFRAVGWYAEAGSSPTGAGAEIGVSASRAHLIGYNRDSSSYIGTTIAGSNIILDPRSSYVNITGSGAELQMDGTKHLTGSHDLGNISKFYLSNNFSGTYINASGNYLNIQTATGYTRIGSNNSSYTHFYTDRPNFYFGTGIVVNGDIIPYTNDARDLGSTSLAWKELHVEDIRFHSASGAVGGIGQYGSLGDIEILSDHNVVFKETDAGTIKAVFGLNGPNFTFGQTTENTSYRVYVNGTIGSTSNITAYASDERLKTNIVEIDNPIEKVKQLRGVTFDWQDDVEEKGFEPAAKNETGVIAQEVQKVIPDAVVPAPFDPDYLTVQHEKIVPLLIEAIKKQQEEIEELKKIAHPKCGLETFDGYKELMARIEQLEKDNGSAK